ncbi:MAG TPA: hypothetical protein VGF45_16165 [Polyangia bacterium]
MSRPPRIPTWSATAFAVTLVLAVANPNLDVHPYWIFVEAVALSVLTAVLATKDRLRRSAGAPVLVPVAIRSSLTGLFASAFLMVGGLPPTTPRSPGIGAATVDEIQKSPGRLLAAIKIHDMAVNDISDVVRAFLLSCVVFLGVLLWAVFWEDFRRNDSGSSSPEA